MSKVTRKTLARGVKLATQHVFDVVQAIVGQVNDPQTGLNAENFAQKETPWTVHLQAPVLDSQFFAAPITAYPPQELCFPFILLPPQDQYNSSGQISESTVQHTLNTISISFDTRAEGVGIGDQFSVKTTGPSTTQGFARSDLSQDYVLTVRVSEKQPVLYNGVEPYVSQRDIFAGTLDFAFALSGGTVIIKINPFTWSNLSRQIDPYKTYIVRVACPQLFNNLDYELATTELCAALVSLNIQLSGTSTIFPRDMGADNVQNLPTVSDAFPNPDTVAVNVPSGGDTVRGDGPYGINTAFRTLDNLLSNRLKTGYGKDSNLPPTENFSFAGYHVIAVPLFQAFGPANRMIARDATMFPFTSGTDSRLCVDERKVMIEFPFTIHHIIAVQNFCAPPNQDPNRIGNVYPAAYQQPHIGQRAEYLTLQQQIGVALGTGIRGDLFAYQPIANLTFAGAIPSNQCIDLFKQAIGGILSEPPSGQPDYDFAMFPVPLVGAGGTGPVAQGKPVFCGRASTVAFPRTNVDGAEPNTKGLEQWLEVRWGFKDTSGDGLVAIGSGGSAPETYSTYVGTGGHWVFILGKKHPYGGKTDVKV